MRRKRKLKEQPSKVGECRDKSSKIMDSYKQ